MKGKQIKDYLNLSKKEFSISIADSLLNHS